MKKISTGYTWKRIFNCISQRFINMISFHFELTCDRKKKRLNAVVLATSQQGMGFNLLIILVAGGGKKSTLSFTRKKNESI